MLANPRMAALSGAVLAFLLLVLWAWAGGVDALGLTSFAIRFLHVLSGMVWVPI